MTIAIEKNIPVPARTHDSRVKYPFHAMEVGDSFAVPAVGIDVELLTKRMRTTMGAAARRLSRKFVLAVESTAEGQGIRVWRAA